LVVAHDSSISGLRARRERRANKAFIRKDRTQSSAAVGAAAAAKVKKASKKRCGESDENESPSPEKVKKKKRTSAEKGSRAKVQDLRRPSAIGAQRLTVRSLLYISRTSLTFLSVQLKPPKQLGGIFNKGKASTRIKVGKQRAQSSSTFLLPLADDQSPSSS
jgi:hypothetical protein